MSMQSTLRTGGALRAAAVGKRFRRKVVLDRVSLEVGSGEAVALVGENGAGKTTLLRICAGTLEPDEGRVTATGRVGYCPQEPGLLDLLSADEHLVLFGAAGGLASAEALETGRVVLGGLGFPVGDRTLARELSGGARQKLNLALALLGEPSVLLLDEPYQAFDRSAYVAFWEHVERWRGERKAVVVVSHFLPDLGVVDRVVELAFPRSAQHHGRGELR